MSAAPNLVIPASDLNQLKAAGFTQPTKANKPPRISIASEGRTKMGKTHFALMTTPEPVAVITMDPGTMQVIEKAVQKGRRIMPCYIAHHKKEDQATAKKLWDEYRKAIRAVMATKSVKTLVIDTITEAWELLQMAEFGKLKQNNKFAYGPLNAEFGGLIDEAYYGCPSLNAVYIQKVKKLYTAKKAKEGEADMGGDWDGKTMEASGYKDLDYRVDLSIVHAFKDRQFSFETKASQATRFGGEYSGLRFEGKECTFMDLALHIFKDDEMGSDPEYWGMKF